MFEVDDEPVETLHIYVVREAEAAAQPSLLPMVLSLCALCLIIAISVFTPYQPPVMRAVIRVPAVLLPVRNFSVSVPVIPTGIQTYPATTAHGMLTITNGSIITQIVPAGFTTVSTTGVLVVTDRAVFVPAGSADGYGVAYVSAHALISGKAGNIPALAIDTVEGSSVYIRSLSAFHGGRDSYSVRFATPQDKQTALITARRALTIRSAGLHYPCSERSTGAVRVTWRCQFVTYHIPALYHVTGIKIIGKNLLLAVWFVARPVHIWVK
jgi:hypothetical protein